MSKLKGLFNNCFRLPLFVVVFVAVVYVIARNISAFGNVLLVLLGFGAVVLVHEFGHFVVAKLSGIKVEAFSIFMPPTLLGVQRTADGLRFRILPKLFAKKDDEGGDGLLSFSIGEKGKAGETEYRIGLIPFGGFVKLLGQEDTGPVNASDDPRSFANKPLISRVAVLAAGVVFNTISAIAVFMIVFLIGIELPPAVVGGVLPDMPAARAGLKAGDEITEIAGKSDGLDFSNIGIAAALSGRDEKVPLRVRHEDGSEEDLELVAEETQTLTGKMRLFGIVLPQSLTVAELSKDDANNLHMKTGLLPGDRIVTVNGREVRTHWEFEGIIQDALVPKVTLLAKRTRDSGEVESIESQIRLNLSPVKNHDIKTESYLGHIYSMVPRLWITAVSGEQISTVDDTGPSLQRGDIILALGDVENPTFKELREPMKVLRADANGVEETLTIIVKPRRPRGGDRPLIGIVPVLDTEHPVVAKTIAIEGGPAKLAIPRGAAITEVDGVAVSNFYDIIREIRRCAGERITIDYRLDEEIAGDVVLTVDTGEEFINVNSDFAESIPFEGLKKLYKASGPVNAIAMGCKKTVMFIAQTYVTLKRLIWGLVSPKNLMGPVGIITFSYSIVAEQPFIHYVYFLSLISAVIAVFNFLPLPPLDGGLVALLLVEKIKGSALTEKTQGAIAYVGWALILTLLLYVTFNDIVRTFFS
ncbi:MAG: M50 family metallopeptidase [Planctomycetota bacterium]|jgi:regulator of sigma E protease